MRTPLPAFHLVVISLLGLVGCHGGGSTQAVTWGGGTYTWKTLSHRVSYIRAIQQADGGADMGLVGGDWSGDGLDSGLFRMRHTAIESRDLAVFHGQSDLMIGPEGTLTVTETIDDPDIAAMSQHIVLLRGYAIDTDVPQTADFPSDTYDPALGYLTQGFSYDVGAPTVSGDTLSFDVRGAVHWAPAGPDDPIDRSDMNDAIPTATTAMTVAWTVVGWEGGLDQATSSGTVDYGSDGPYTEMPPLAEDDLPLNLDGGSPGIAGLTAVDLTIGVDDDDEQGEYLRSFGAELVPNRDLEPPVGLQAEMTNSTLVQTADIWFRADLAVAWLSLDDPDATAMPMILDGHHEVGLYEAPTSDAVAAE